MLVAKPAATFSCFFLVLLCIAAAAANARLEREWDFVSEDNSKIVINNDTTFSTAAATEPPIRGDGFRPPVARKFHSLFGVSDDETKLALEIQLVNWSNPRHIVYSGQLCDFWRPMCEHRFYVDLHKFACNITTDDLTWPGPRPVSQWHRIGESEYHASKVEQVGSLVYYRVPSDQAKQLLLRVRVVDVDVAVNDDINFFFCQLPGIVNSSDTRIGDSQTTARWSETVECDSIFLVLQTNFLPRASAKRDALATHRLSARMRVWRDEPVDVNSSTFDFVSGKAVSPGNRNGEQHRRKSLKTSTPGAPANSIDHSRPLFEQMGQKIHHWIQPLRNPLRAAPDEKIYLN